MEIYTGIPKSFEAKRRIIKHDILNGFEYIITSLGSHPCAYVVIGKEHPLYEVDLVNHLGVVHGGVTYCEKSLSPVISLFDEKWIIGWDYAHYDDFVGYNFEHDDWGNVKGKMWTVDEIMKDVQLMVDFLKDEPPKWLLEVVDD